MRIQISKYIWKEWFRRKNRIRSQETSLPDDHCSHVLLNSRKKILVEPSGFNHLENTLKGMKEVNVRDASMKLSIIAVTSGPWTIDSLTRILATIFSSRLLLQLCIGNLGGSGDYQQNRRENITNLAFSSTCTWIHSLTFNFEVCNTRLILKVAFSLSPRYSEDVLIVRVLTVSSSFTTSHCSTMWCCVHSILMSSSVWKILCRLTRYSLESLTYIPSF